MINYHKYYKDYYKNFLLTFSIIFLIFLTGCNLSELKIITDYNDIAITLNQTYTVESRIIGSPNNYILEYFSTDEEIFYLDGNIIIPVSIGNASLEIKIKDKDIKITIPVTIDAIPILGLKEQNYNLELFEEVNLELLLNGKQIKNLIWSNNSDADVYWVSSSDILEISKEGILKANKVGVAQLTIYYNDLSINTLVNITKEYDLSELEKVSILNNNQVEIEQLVTFQLFGNDDQTFKLDNNLFNWTSSNEEVAPLIGKGRVIANKIGSSIITAIYEANPMIQVSFNLNVVFGKLNLTLSSNSEIYAGLKDIRIISKNSKGAVVNSLLCEYESLNPNIVSVNTDGSINPITTGEAKIIVKTQNAIGEIIVVVSDAPLGNQRNEIVMIALNEKGYREGTNNNTKYGAWYGLNYEPWCAMFVSWAADQAGVSTTIVPKYAAVAYGLEWYQRKGSDYYKSYEQTQSGEYVPICGDIVFFKSNGASHTGIVIKVVGDIMYTIEGNTSDQVLIRWYYYKNYEKITGYGIPGYLPSSTPIYDFDVTGALPGGGAPTT